MTIVRIVSLMILLGCACAAPAAETPEPVEPPPGPDPAALANWRAQRFGMFIHWGPVSLTGREIGWSRGAQTPIEEYDALYKKFNPVDFDADAWVRTAKEAGMRYMVLTTKHHDGFCLWDTKQTDFNIMNSPFGRDVVKELSEACKRQGIRFGTYYSTCDWHHPAFPKGSPGGRTEKPNPDLAAYDRYLQAQVTELVTKYGPLFTLWFDVPQVYTWEYGIPMVTKLRALQPDIIINNRAYAAPGRTSKFSHQHTVGDFTTPEQRVGGFDRERPWETCMTICRQWAWKPDDTMKTLPECLRVLLATAGGDGNLLFNVGPMPDGRIEPRQVERLREMGAWLAKYGDGVYGTRGGPFKPGSWGASTCKGNQVYLYVMAWPARRPLLLPLEGAKLRKVETLSGGTVSAKEEDGMLALTASDDAKNEIATVVRLTLDRPAFDLEPVEPLPPYGKPLPVKASKASNVFQKQPEYEPAKAFDGNTQTRWATDSGTTSAWIEADLGAPATVCAMVVREAIEKRVQAFTLERETADGWATVCEGKALGDMAEIEFAPVEAQRLRLSIAKASEGPTLWEVQFFGPHDPR